LFFITCIPLLRLRSEIVINVTNQDTLTNESNNDCWEITE
jgi:hypothetical protein